MAQRERHMSTALITYQRPGPLARIVRSAATWLHVAASMLKRAACLASRSAGIAHCKDLTPEEANMAVALLLDIILDSPYDSAAQVRLACSYACLIGHERLD